MEGSNSIFISAREAIAEVYRYKIIKYISQTTKRKRNDFLLLNAGSTIMVIKCAWEYQMVTLERAIYDKGVHCENSSFHGMVERIHWPSDGILNLISPYFSLRREAILSD